MGFRDDLFKYGATALGRAQDRLIKASGGGEDDANDSDRTPGGPREDTPKGAPVPSDKSTEDPKSLFWDPFSIVEQLGYKDKPSPISFHTLKAITWRMPIVQAIIQTRINQVAAFSRPSHDRYQLGFRVKLRDTAKEPTKVERTWSEQMETLFCRTGVTDNPRGRDDFETFLRKLTRDSLIYDQNGFEIVPNRKNEPAEWYAVDAATIRLADSATTYLDEDNEKAIRTVQVYDSMIIAEYSQEEMAFGVRNPHTDIRLHGYGVSELEMLATTITSLLWSFEYNQNFFRQGTASKGIINFKGIVPEKQLASFRRQWYSMLSGVKNSWKTPITNSDDLQYINLQQSNRDMEFNSWIDFLIKICCSCYSMDPIEVNFKYGNVGERGGLNEASNKEKITESKERGLRPILRFYENLFNKFLVWPVNENFEFSFVGLDSKTADEVAELNSKRVKTFMTVDEIRAEDDMPPLADGKGEVILDPTWLQNKQQIEGGGMEEDGGFGDGEMGEGEPEEGEDGKDGKEPNYEKMLAAYEDDEDAADDADKEEEEERRKKAIKKSDETNWIIQL